MRGLSKYKKVLRKLRKDVAQAEAIQVAHDAASEYDFYCKICDRYVNLIEGGAYLKHHRPHLYQSKYERKGTWVRATSRYIFVMCSRCHDLVGMVHKLLRLSVEGHHRKEVHVGLVRALVRQAIKEAAAV